MNSQFRSVAEMFASVSICIFFLSTASTEVLQTSNEPFHWNALITPMFNNNSFPACSGAFIGKKHVIMSGKCVDGFSKFRIRLGAHYVYHEAQNQTKIDFAYDLVVRTNIGSKHVSADRKLTIIRLDQHVAPSVKDYVQPIALPPKPTLMQLNDALGTNSTVLALYEDSDGTVDQRQLRMNVLLFTECVSVRTGVNIHVELCAAGDKVDGKYLNLCLNTDPNNGRGYGPLLVSGNDNDRVSLIGIGLENCVDDKPQIFVRINGYWTWIDQVQSYVDD